MALMVGAVAVVHTSDVISAVLLAAPGSASAAVVMTDGHALMMGALLISGIQPGPRIVTEHLDLIYTIVRSFALANVIGAGLAFLVSPVLARPSYVPFDALAPAVLLVMIVGAYQDTPNLGDGNVIEHAHASPAVPLSRARRRAVTGGVLLGMFLAALEATVVGTAMPTVVASLGGLAHYSWVFSAYMLTSTATVPVWGRLSDLHGRRRVYLIGIAVFLAGSALSGTASSMPALVAFRAIQGVGAGALVPLALTIIGEIYTLDERSRMQAVFSSVWGLASIVGPLVGGYLTDAISWRWIFYVNLPFGFAAALVLGRTYPDSLGRGRIRVDWPGAALLFGSVASLLAALSGLGGAWWGWLAAGLAAAAAFVRAERLAAEPILPLDLFGDRRVALPIATAFLVGMAIFGAIAFIPLFVQGTRGASAIEAGTALTPLMLGWVLMSIAAARLILRAGHRRTIVAGTALMAAAFVLLAHTGPGTPRWRLLADVALLGAGTGLASLSLLLVIQHSVPRDRLGIATSLNLFARSIGGAAGVAVMGAILAAGLGGGAGPGLGPASGHTPPLDPGGAAPAAAREALARAMRPVFGAGAAIAGLALLAGLRLPPFDPAAGGGGPGTGGRPGAGGAAGSGGGAATA